jgi:hypothetical protein
MHSVLVHWLYIYNIVSLTCFDTLWIIFREHLVYKRKIGMVLTTSLLYTRCFYVTK